MKRLYARLSALIPYPYSHLLVASLIACVTLSPMAGAMFYVGREVRDLQKQHDWNMAGFDWPGFLWGVVPMAALEIALRL